MHQVDYETLWQGKWNDTTIYGPACRHRRRIIRNLISKLPRQTILDLGCGDGSLLAEISGVFRSSKMEGMDISDEALTIARRNLPCIAFTRADLNGTVRLKQTYDVIILSEVLEHLENDESLLRQIAPSCRSVVISVPGGPADRVDARYGHMRNYPATAIVEKLNRCGFDLLLFKRWGWPLYDLQQRLAYPDKNAENAIAAGPYTLAGKIIAKMVYAAYFLNWPGTGTQVFAVGRSAVNDPSANRHA
ncbi:MAG: class I SAM-dependent methyltransferase [Kiritimatiellia bacterium]